jgi:16S rRNA (cytidine1402-2'-O)-methyltransferase
VGGVLYVVATPIGNLEDITLRALRVLREVDLIAAEDTRHTRKLLEHHGIRRPLTSYYDAVERHRAPKIVSRLVAGESVALVSDAGTPGIADPGYHLVRGALAAGVPVVPVPGPSAVAAVVSVAGLPADRFVFEGFLPNRSGPRAQRLAALAREPRALVFLEAARRLPAFLAAAHEALGDRDVVLARELTKLHEEIVRGRLGAVREQTLELRGEVTVLIAGATEQVADDVSSLDDEIRAARAAGRPVKEIAADLAGRTGMPRREIYRRALALDRGDGEPTG